MTFRGQDRQNSKEQRIAMTESALRGLTQAARSPAIAAWILAGLLLLTSLAVSSRRPLWFDEYATLYIARSGDFSRMAFAVKSGADTMPPYFHWLEWCVLRLGLPEETSIRLLPALGVCAGFLCLFHFLLPICGGLAALAGAMVPLAAGVVRFAWEGRPYGILFGLSAAAALAWQRIGTARAASVGMSAALAAASLIHPFAVAVTAAISCAEIWMSAKKGSWRVSALSALMIAGSAVLPNLEFIRAARANFGKYFFASASFSSFYASYEEFFAVLWPLIVLGALWPGLTLFLDGRLVSCETLMQPQPSVGSRTPPAFHAGAALGIALLVLLPAGTWLALKLLGGGLIPRYVLPMTIGAGILWGLGLAWASVPQRLAVLGCLLAIISLKIYSPLRSLSRNGMHAQTADILQFFEPILRRAQGQVVVSNAELFLDFWHVAPEWAKNRIVFIADPEKAAEIRRKDAVDRTMAGLERVGGPRVEQYRAFLERNPTFTLVANRNSFEWLAIGLLRDGCRLNLKELRGVSSVFSVSCR